MRGIIYWISAVIVSTTAHAGGYYYGAHIDEYDKDSGLYYRSIKSGVTEKGIFSSGTSENVSDIHIFDPSTNKSTLVFGDRLPRKITTFTYESEYLVESKSIKFGNNDHNYAAKNNHGITPRKPRNLLLIETYNDDKKLTELWTAEKPGNNLKKIRTLDNNTEWHIDIKNSKMRFVTITDGKVAIDSIDW